MSDELFEGPMTEQVERIKAFSVDFDELCQQRHLMGAEKYGPLNFVETNTIEMAIEEVADMANYLRYTFIKLRMLQQAIADQSVGVEAPSIGLDSWKELK